MDNQEILVFYPTWVKILGFVGLPIMVVVAICAGLMPLYEVDLTNVQIFLFPLIGLAVLYQCYIGFKCFKYFSLVLVIHDLGVDTYFKGEVREYSYSDLSVVHHAFATTTQIKSKDGETIGYFSDNLSNLGLLVDTIENGLT